MIPTIQLYTGEVFISLVYIFLPLILGGIHIKLKGGKSKAEIFFMYYLFIGVGVQGLLTGIVEMSHKKIIEDYLHFPSSSFLIQLGMANISFGILGVLSVWENQGWKAATAIGYSLFFYSLELAILWIYRRMALTKEISEGFSGQIF